MLILILPSIYFAYSLFEEKKYYQNAELFTQNEFTNRGYTVIYKKLSYKNERKIELAVLTKKFSETEIATLTKKLPEYGINHTDLIIKQDSTDLKGDILKEIGKTDKTINEKDLVIAQLQQKLDSYNFDTVQILAAPNSLPFNSKHLPSATHLSPRS